MISPELEAVATPTGAAFSDSVTFSWGDREADVYGVARLGLSPGPLGSALVLLFADGAPAAAHAHGGGELETGADWRALRVGPLRASVDEPLVSWRVACEFGDGNAFALAFHALGAAGELDARVPGMEGYEQLCAVSGSVTVAGVERGVQCLGQRGHAWGEPDWRAHELARTVTAWLEDRTGVVLSATRPAGAVSHAEESVWASVIGGEEPLTFEEPRLSTTYDGDGRHVRAGLELWKGGEEDFAHRGAGRALCGASLELGQLHLDCSFFEWHLDGREGVGRYDVLRRAATSSLTPAGPSSRAPGTRP